MGAQETSLPITEQVTEACARVLRESGMLTPESERLAEALAFECLAAARAVWLGQEETK